MFSFFKSKKEEPQINITIQPAPIPERNTENNDFVIINNDPVRLTTSSDNIPAQPQLVPHVSVGIIHPLQNIPFKLSPEISTQKNSGNLDVLLLKINEIISIANQNRDSKLQYDFALERNFISQTQ
uniref:UMA domain-containing protein n=1 Tax=Corethrella appendiculata TaxID=1370023 RepID=U5ES03_9DIPT